MDAINRSLSYIYEYTQSLMDDGDTLTDDLADLKTDIENTLATCGTQECRDLEDDVGNLAAVADYSNVGVLTPARFPLTTGLVEEETKRSCGDEPNCVNVLCRPIV